MIRLTKDDIKRIQMEDPTSKSTTDQMQALLNEMDIAFDDDMKDWMAKFVEFTALASVMHGKLDPVTLMYVLFSTGVFMGAKMQERKTNPHMTVHLQFHGDKDMLH